LNNLLETLSRRMKEKEKKQYLKEVIAILLMRDVSSQD
jgi:hypothetical protein